MEDLERYREIPISRIMGLSGKKDGRRYSIRCPFHADKDPSMSIKPQDGGDLYHCFGCDVGGSGAIDFLVQSGCTFTEAINELKPFI